MADVRNFVRREGLIPGLAAVLLFPASGLAADATLEERMSDAPIFDTVVYWGVDYSHGRLGRDGIGADAGFVTAINGDIDTAGWTLTGNLGLARTTSTGSSSNSFTGSVLVGYQWQAPAYYFTLAGGVHYVNNNETPAGGVTDGSELGAIFQYGFETKRENAFYVQSYGAYSTAFDQAYFHAKAGYKAATLRFGPEFTAYDERGSDPTLRYGVFVGDIPIGDRLSMVVSAGYQQELDPTEADGYYATIGFSVPLSLH